MGQEEPDQWNPQGSLWNRQAVRGGARMGQSFAQGGRCISRRASIHQRHVATFPVHVSSPADGAVRGEYQNAVRKPGSARQVPVSGQKHLGVQVVIRIKTEKVAHIGVGEARAKILSSPARIRGAHETAGRRQNVRQRLKHPKHLAFRQKLLSPAQIGRNIRQELIRVVFRPETFRDKDFVEVAHALDPRSLALGCSKAGQ